MRLTKGRMQTLNTKLNNFFSNIDALASLIFRFGIGIAFIIHGLGKFPLPPQGLIEYFDLSPALASFVALSELAAGLILIIGGFIKNPFGNLITRAAAFVIIIMMINIFDKLDYKPREEVKNLKQLLDII